MMFKGYFILKICKIKFMTISFTIIQKDDTINIDIVNKRSNT